MPPPSTATNTAATNFFRITLCRSSIGLPHKVRGTLGALGLRRRDQTVILPVEPHVAGMLMRVKELVRVSEVHGAGGGAQDDLNALRMALREERRPPAGFWLEKRPTAVSGGDAGGMTSTS